MSWRSPSTVPMTTRAGGGALALGHVRAQKVEGALHGACAEQHLGDEAVAAAHALADHLHAGEQGLVEDLAGRDAGGEEGLVRAFTVTASPAMRACWS